MTKIVKTYGSIMAVLCLIGLPIQAAAQTAPAISDAERQQVFQQFLTAVALAKSNLGASYYVAGEYDSAKVHLIDALSIAPEFAAAHLTLGLIHYKQGNVDDALDAFHSSADGDTIGQSRMKIVDPDTVFTWASAQFKTIAQEPPGLAVSHTTLAMLYSQGRYMADAEKHYLLAIEHDSMHIDAYTNLGKLYSDTERFDDAKKLYDKALALQVDDDTRSKIFLNIGVSLMGANKADEAIQAWRDALRYNADYSEAFMNIGVAFQAKNMPDSARTYWERSLEMKPDFLGARVVLARLAVEENRLIDAREQYHAILDIGARDPRILAELAFVYERQEDFDQAIAFYEEALKLSPDSTELASSMTIIRNKQKEYIEAIQANKTRIRHIVVPQRAEAEALLLELKNGADFIEMARTKSTDASAANGGDLGFFGTGEMIPAFDEAVKFLKAGEITGIIQTPMGYHIIKREE